MSCFNNYVPRPSRDWSRVQNACIELSLAEANTIAISNKANVLKYKANSSNLTKAQKYSNIAKGFNNNTTWATQSTRGYTNPNTKSLKRTGNIVNIAISLGTGEIIGPTSEPLTCPNTETFLPVETIVIQDGGLLICSVQENVFPFAPTIISITPTNNQIAINFTLPTNNRGPTPTITDYNYSLNNGFTFTSAGTTTSPIIVTGLDYNTTYQVIIRAVNSVADGQLSNMVPVTTPITGSLNYSFTYTKTGLTEQLVLDNIPIKTLAGKFTITSSIISIVSSAVTVEIVTSLYVGSTTTEFGITFNSSNNSLTTFYNGSTSNLTFISSNNCPFSKNGFQFSGLTQAFSIQSGFTPYFLPETSLARCFQNCTNFNSNISNWITSNVINMSNMFESSSTFTSKFNQPIGNWDVSNVTDISSIFYAAIKFNQPIGDWNVSNVINMNNVFRDSWEFNQHIGDWNTKKVTQMNNMFLYAYVFNNGETTNAGSKQLKWDTLNVTTVGQMFMDARKFNQNIGNWDVSKVTTMRYMFFGASLFNNGETTNTGSIPLNWNTTNVTNMERIFYNTKFNQPINTSGNNWNVSNVRLMNEMFRGSPFNQYIGNWDVSKVTNMNAMFREVTVFKQDISNWTPYACTNMGNIFYLVDINNPNSTTNQDNYNALLNSWGNNPRLPLLKNGIVFRADLSKYTISIAGTARSNLTSSTGSGGKGWSITDGGGV